jgi:radical SAM protein with 4Fe4S-binding SPASM domain
MNIRNYINSLQYLRKIFIKSITTPIYIIFFVTEQCNARCKHCFGSFNYSKGKELTIEEIEKISQHTENLLYLLPTGGEPFLREDLPDIINIFYKNNRLRNVGIPTNGSLTETIVASVKQTLSLCKNLNLGVDISIDELHGEHDSIRGFPGLFNKAIDTYWQLKELEKQNNNFKVCVELTVSKFNQDKLFEIYDYFINNLKTYNVFVRLVRGNPRDPSAKDVDIKKFEQFLIKLESDLKMGIVHGHAVYPFSEIITARDILGRRLTMQMIKEKKFQIPCYAGNLTGIIRSNGDVYPCEILDNKIGNLRENNYDLRKIWQSDAANKIRNKIREEKCFCTHECFITNNILFNPKMLPKIFLEYIKLKCR